MGKIYLVPIEPLEERYSTDWFDWFKPIADHIIFAKPLTNKITAGSFLDVCGTNYYKSQQLTEICELVYRGIITDEDTLLFLDIWFPGLEMLAYMRDALGLKFKITGCLHAGTYDPHDYLSKKGMGKWGAMLEHCWFSFVDQIFVATQFHKELVCSKRTSLHPDKVKVTGFPIFDIKAELHPKKANIVVFPHRLDDEKNPFLFDKLSEALSDIHKEWSFVRSKDSCATKAQYYYLLSRSKIAVSFADQETWGIATQEAVICGCIPVVPDRLSYKEMYPDCFRFKDFKEAVGLVSMYIQAYDVHEHSMDTCRRNILENGGNAIPNILSEIKNGA